MFELKKIKAVILVFEDQIYLTKNKIACETVVPCLTIPRHVRRSSQVWNIINSRRPWKKVDQILGGK